MYVILMRRINLSAEDNSGRESRMEGTRERRLERIREQGVGSKLV